MSAATVDRRRHDRSLIDLIDRLETLLNESELSELEVEAGETALRAAQAVRCRAGGTRRQPARQAAAAAGARSSGRPTGDRAAVRRPTPSWRR